MCGAGDGRRFTHNAPISHRLRWWNRERNVMRFWSLFSISFDKNGLHGLWLIWNWLRAFEIWEITEPKSCGYSYEFAREPNETPATLNWKQTIVQRYRLLLPSPLLLLLSRIILEQKLSFCTHSVCLCSPHSGSFYGASSAHTHLHEFVSAWTQFIGQSYFIFV